MLVALRSEGLYCRTFFCVESSELDSCIVAVFSHLATEGVKFADDM